MEAAAVIVAALLSAVVAVVPAPKTGPSVTATPIVPVHVAPVGQHLGVLVRSQMLEHRDSRYVVGSICCAK